MNKFAISSGGVGDALLRSAAAMKSAGNTIDETVALVAAANTIVQNPETVGTTLKTISMYLRAAKTEAEEAGESTEGMASSVSELREEILDLTGKKVDIQVDENTFKSTYQIMEELASVWDSIKDTSKANILEMVGGKRNANVVAALLENFSTAEKALAAAADSAGSALEENEKYLDSIQGKISILKSEFESMAANLIDSEFAKQILDLVTMLLSFANGAAIIIDALGGLPTIISIIGTTALSTSVKIGDLLAKMTFTLPANITGMPIVFQLIKTAAIGLGNTIGKLVSNFVTFGQTVSAFAAGTATAGALIESAIPVVGTLLTVISVGVGIFKKVRSEQEKASQEIKDAGRAAASLCDELSELTVKYLELNDAVKNNAASTEELAKAQDNLISKLGLQKYELDELIKKYGSYEAAIRQAAIIELQDNWIDLRDAAEEHGKTLISEFGESNFLRNQYDIMGQIYGESTAAKKDRLDSYAAMQALKEAGYKIAHEALVYDKNGEIEGLSGFGIEFGQLDSPQKILEAYNDIRDMMNIVGGVNGVTDGNNTLYKQLSSTYKEMAGYVDDYSNSIADCNENLAQQVIQSALLEQGIPKTAAAFSQLRESVFATVLPDNAEYYANGVPMSDLVDELLRTQFGFEKFYSSIGDYNHDPIGDMISNYSQQMSGLKIAVQEFEETGKISAETYRKYFVGNEELNELVDASSGKLILNTEALKEHISTLEDETIKNMAASGATEEQLNWIHRSTVAVTTLIEEEYRSIEKLSEIQKMIEDLKKDEKDQKIYSSDEYYELIDKYPELIEYAEDVGEGYKFQKEGLEKVIELEKKRIKLSAQETAGVKDAKDKLYKNKEVAVVNKMDELFSIYGDGIRSRDDFNEAYKQFWATDTVPEFTDDVNALIDALILAEVVADSLYAEIEKFGTDGYNPGNSTENNNNKSTKTEKTEFEKQYELHQHYVAMEQETEEEYLNWLEGAWQAAYRNGQIEEGEQYQYEEELYEGRKELFSDYLKDTEHQIAMMRNREAGVSELIPIYKQLMSDVETQKAKYIEYGLDENSDYIQELESQWWDYRNEMLDVYEEILDNNISDYEHSISLIENNDINHERTAEIVDIYRTMQAEVHALAEEYRALGLDENSDYIQKLQQQWWDYQGELDRIREEEFERSIELGEYRIESMVQDGAAVDEIVDSWKEMLSAVNSEIEYYTSRGYSLTSEVVRKLEEKAEEFRDSMIDAIESVVQKANDLVDGFENVYSTLTTAAKEYAQNGFLSVDSLQSILELGPKYLAMLKDENGHLVINEAALQDVIKARTEEMAAETALAYAKQILIATEENDIVKLTELVSVSETAGNATWNMAYATVGLAKAIAEANGIDTSYYDTAFENLSNMQSLANTAANSISAYYKTLDESYISQKDALDKILQLTQDMIKHENDKQKEALEEQKKDYADIIDQKKDMLRLAEEQEDREKSVAEKLEKMAKLQGQIAQLSLDDSREAQAKRRSLEAELAELQKELENDQSDYALEIQEERLDKELEAYEKEKDDEIKALEDNLSSAEKLYQAAIDRIENGWDTLYDDLKSWNYEYGSTLQSELETAWNSALKAAERYGSFVDALDGVKGYTDLGYNSAGNDETLSGNKESSSRAANDIIERMKKNSLAWFTADSDERATIEESQQSLRAEWKSTFGESLIRKSDGSWYRPGSTTPLYELDKDDVAKHIVRQMEFNADAWHTASPDERNNLAAENVELAKRLENYLGIKIKKGSDGVWYLGSVGGKELFDVYHTGGIVGGSTSLRDNEVMALLEEGEAVLDDQKKKGLFGIVDFISELSERLGTALDISRVGGILGTTSRTGTGLDYADKITKESERILSKVNTGDTVYNVERMDVTAPVNVVQKLSKDEIREHAETIGSLSAEYIKEGFTKRGIKKSASLF